MSSPRKEKGARAEREVAALLNDHLGIYATRELGAGRLEDIGDIHGVPDTTIQVANWADLNRAVREKLPATEQQRIRANAAFAALFVRRHGGSYVVVQTPAMWCDMWKAAIAS